MHDLFGQRFLKGCCADGHVSVFFEECLHHENGVEVWASLYFFSSFLEFCLGEF